MSQLQSIDELSMVENLTHRSILELLRNTSLTVGEISERLNLDRTKIYYVVRHYLPKNYLKRRKDKQQFQDVSGNKGAGSVPEDLVRIVPAMNRRLEEGRQQQKRPAAQKESEKNISRSTQKFAAQADYSETPSVRCLTLEHGGFILRWESSDDPRTLENVFAIMNEFKRTFGD